MNSPRAVAVCGNAVCGEATYEKARAVGKLLAGQGITLFNGGLSGVMEASSRGASEAGGHTVGILPTYDVTDANPFVQLPIATGMGHARNVVLVASVGCVIAVEGSFGTLSEIALALKLGRPVIGLDTWDIPKDAKGFHAVGSPEEAVALAVELL